jgi:hypothetical protein
VALAQGHRLRGLNEALGAVGVFLEIHVSTPSAHGGTGQITGPLKAARLMPYVGAFIASLKTRAA